ncbi:GH3 auxin-responsive promoter family protein [Corallococcus sp. CA041A]|uniref:GH3 auxin-responsive promoter family protein n=1 Tax=Corallococcus sp. CA041A TaxID=2316727 RepID=UPI001F24A977|nr:GH3 auxin-responsive promoter family protein [Corallococcus sp. CA041A]
MLTSRAMLSATMAALTPSALRFRHALREPEVAQAECLARILRAVEGTAQAERLPHFGRIRTAREFQDAVPITTPDTVAEDVERIARGEARVLTREPVLRFELSGGSSGASKRVPVTQGLLREFQRALAPMLHEVFLRRPAVREGPSYWSISPLGRRQHRTSGGIPVGSAEDSAWFPRPLQPLLSRVFAVPGSVGQAPHVEPCRYVTLWFLVRCSNLSLISVWNPSFLTLLMDALERHGERLAEDLERGTLRPPEQDADGTPVASDPAWTALVQGLQGVRDIPRAQVLRAALRDGRTLWPGLALLSMWTDAQALHAVAGACRRFPGVEVQGKGLLATEGVITVPLFEAPAPVLAVRSHFIEFMDPERPDARPLLAHELTAGRTYAVLLSTSGGLLRYRLGDLVRVEGFVHATPCLRFLGRADAVSDLVGEKLSAARVGTVLDAALGPTRPAFAMLAPEWGTPPAYRLFLETDLPTNQLDATAANVERALCEGHHYRYARELGQLGPVHAVRVTQGARRYEARCIQLGQRAGDIKPVDLHRQAGWAEWFGRGTS